MCTPSIMGGGSGRSMNTLVANTRTADSINASSELAAFREERSRSDYRTAGEAGDARENSLKARVNRGINPLQAIMQPATNPPASEGGLQIPT